ncbi:MAG TPA: hypothetical protein VGK16_02025 [Candidatus Limnocylindrales bacterium]|jgi:hypothetical protein
MDRTARKRTEVVLLHREAREDGHVVWVGNTRTTDTTIQAERTAAYRGTCGYPGCIAEDHQGGDAPRG